MRTRVAAFIAAFAALALVAAGEPTQPAGTAQTRLTAAELSVSGVPSPVEGLTLLDIQTFASTDTDTAKNRAGAPFSTATISPVQLNGEDLVDPVTVSSDGDTSGETATIDESVGVASVALNPVGMTANAASDSASATITAATAQVTALSDALGISLNHVPGVSSVDAKGATATSGIGVSGVELSLGELLPVDLADLPLDTLLGLATLLEDQLSVTGLDLSALNAAIAALQGAVDDLAGLAGDYGDAVEALNAVVGQINAAVAELIEVTDAATLTTDIQRANGLAADATALDLNPITNPDVVTDVLALVNEHDSLVSTYGGSGVAAIGLDATAIGLLTAGDLDTLVNTTIVGNAGDLANYVQGGLDAVNTITTLGASGGVLDEAIAAVNAAVAAIEDFLASTDLEQLITDLTTILDGLLELVPELIGDLDVSSLLDVDPISVTVGATATADSATPSITCGGGAVAVAGIQVVSDIDGCDAVNGVGDTLNGALATVGDVLGTLTTVEVPTPTLDLFVERRESSGQDGAYRTATAGINALVLDLPSVDLDAVVQGVLDGGLSTILDADLFALLNGLVDELGTAIATIDGDAGDLIAGTVGDALGALEGTVTDVTSSVDTSGVDDAEAALDALLADLADLIAGAVPDTGLKTPGVNLKVDPVSTVEFAPGTAAPAPPTGPTPAPDPDPSLPATGGGLALLGALALAGGVALRRRR